MQNKAVPPSRNPHLTRLDRSAFELGRLLKGLPENPSDLSRAPKDVRLKAEAAAHHARNATGTILDGLEAIGNLTMRAAADSGVGQPEAHEIRDIAALITHLAVEAQFLRSVEDDLAAGLAEQPIRMVVNQR